MTLLIQKSSNFLSNQNKHCVVNLIYILNEYDIHHEKIFKVHAAKTEEYLVGKALGDQDTVKGTKRTLYWLHLSIYTLFLEIVGFIQRKSYKMIELFLNRCSVSFEPGGDSR